MKKLGKSILKDSMWSIAGIVLMNAVAQFLIYPLWDRQLGSDAYGNILYLLSLMNIVAVSLGTALNYARMCNKGSEVKNRSYLLILGGGAVIFGAAAILCRGFLSLNLGTAGLFALLIGFTMWRFYADVEFRLSLNYKGYFLYYLLISIGYGAGALLFLKTGEWVLALLFGELLGVAFVLWKGKVLRPDGLPTKAEFFDVGGVVAALFGSNLISNLIFNGDRLILKFFIGGTAVTTYYLASLIGKTAALVTTPLNSVLIGYLMRYEGGLKKRTVSLLAGGSVAVSLIGMLGCFVASIILLPILYPAAEYEAAKPFLWLGNLAQIVYFVGNMLNTTLLRFGKKQDQLYVNVLYGVAFVVLCVPATYLWKLWGFCIAYLVTTLVRLTFALVLLFVRNGKPRQEEPALDD